ncbi:MAG TPA: endonuclease III [Blastocatellia bacterium]|nr:endonuclease III [Blastocatellia bacterium]
MPETIDSAAENVPHIIRNLKATFGAPKPERELDPLDVLVETILSQATSDTNSRRAYQKLKERFPAWESVRTARVTSIEAAIRSGGLAKQKSARIKSLLNEVRDRLGSLDLGFLRTAPVREAKDFLGSFKGVGPKTVACTLLFACNRPVFPVDTHIMRIGRRLSLIPARCSDEEAHRIMGELVPARRCYEVHINLIRHGRRICRPQNPLCEQCCLIDYCDYYRTTVARTSSTNSTTTGSGSSS